MRELTPDEQAKLKRQAERLEQFLAELMPVLADFAERLGLPNAVMIVANPESFLEPTDDFMKDQVIETEDREWIMARLGYFIGEVLVQRFGGGWFLSDTPYSRFFLRYVVGKFEGGVNRRAMIDPFLVADTYLAEPPGRSLPSFLKEVEAEVMKA